MKNRDLESDFTILMQKLRGNGDRGFYPILEKLLKLWDERRIKSNHTIMEVVLAYELYKRGFEVDVEKPLGNNLVCDIYATKRGEVEIVEIETGFVPPENCLDPGLYRKAREISKIVRYSPFADIFAFATPPTHILYIDELFYRRKNKRRAKKIKGLLDMYYRNPPISLPEILKAHIEKVYVIDVDECRVMEFSVEEYKEVRGELVDLTARF